MEEPAVEVQSGDAIAVANGVELSLGEIAGGGADGMDIGVSGDQWCIRDGSDVFGVREGETGVAVVDASSFDETMKALDAVVTP